MRKTKIHTIAIKSFALLVVFATACEARSQDAATTYAKMAPVDQYLMADRDAEIALARTAAPDSIARDAEVLVLGRHGFEAAVKGKNGFVCIVGRGWTSAADPDFWNPKVRVPMCVNAPAARSYLPRVTKETEWGLAGYTQAQMTESIAAAVAKKELPPMERGAMCYMMGKQPATWGANLPGSPVIAVADPTEHLTQFVIPVGHWSDGTDSHPGSAHEHHH
jgi:hypothetical protein